MSTADTRADRFQCQGCWQVMTSPAEVEDHQARHGLVINIGSDEREAERTIIVKLLDERIGQLRQRVREYEARVRGAVWAGATKTEAELREDRARALQNVARARTELERTVSARQHVLEGTL